MSILNPSFNVGCLLEEYGINSPQDYENLKDVNMKSSFCRRLFKLLEKESEITIHELKKFRNSFRVNIHYAVSLNENCCIGNLPCATFLKKASFFASRVIISFPFPAHSKIQFLNPSIQVFGKRDIEALELRSQKFGYEIFYGLLKLICQCRLLLKENCLKIIPIYSENQKKIEKILEEECELLSANFELEKLIYCFEEVNKDVLLQPHFSKIREEDIVKIKRIEKAIYEQFEIYFHNLIYDLDSPDQFAQEKIFLRELVEISKGVHQLMISFDNILDKSSRLKKGLQIFSGLTVLAGVCPAILLNQFLVGALIGTAGTVVFPGLIVSIIQDWFINNYEAIQEYKKQDEVYLAWRMAYPETDRYFKPSNS
ncbi:hypothetical protein [Nodosilinea sp. P-1105]|uniref:hypothetical protein n=1 Tax=Nodosilinea sp. P-1105 TaxID=2546229 RepID=UPI00146BBF1A|nr:hypothetical protein [Nodosilinea sp. P-1105]NMF82035.1 hypothetical protein [Nodosilinea sp. P-1105]